MRIVRTAHAEGLVDLRMRYGLPRQTPSLWRRELANALEWRPGQVELVPLMVEPGSRMWEEGTNAGAPASAPVASGGTAMPAVSQEAARQLADVAADVLGGAGYERVAGAITGAGSRAGDADDAGGEEVWALPGRESRLTRARTARVETLGLGVGAASRIDGFAYENADDLDLYLAKSADISAIVRDARRVG
jgi:coproporphyrinogen III oxidase-like Fe-S oxidoreductase